MDTSALKKFAQGARRDLVAQVSARLDIVLAAASDERRDHPDMVKSLDVEIHKTSKADVIEKAAYTWFNRFSALMFMDRNAYNIVRVVTPNDGEVRPAILSDALGGQLGDSLSKDETVRITGLLNRTQPSQEPELEAYKILLARACQDWHRYMPFMFGRLDDWTELLMPGDLLAETSVLTSMREVMTEETCQDVEIIGWLYQFYISEKKDEVFAGLKKNIKITAENIPAATQLFTPHWIVRYLVENSLGRLWLLNRPDSSLAEQMDYYIAPEEPETDFLRINSPEDIRICDPAVGSGHMLTYAFDLLYAIYEEDGYNAADIPALILTHNLTGIEIDDRAGALAAFALAMKAAAKLGRRRFLRMEAKPDICVMQNVAFTDAEMQDVAAVVGKDLFTKELRETLGQFEQAKNFGSLIVPKLCDPAEALRVVEAQDFGGDLLLKEVQERVITVLRMAEALSPKYHVVVANPPYMGAAGMNPILKNWVNQHYPQAKSDLMTCFMKRCAILSATSAYWGMINLPSWLFLSSFEDHRGWLVKQQRFLSLLHLGRGIFGSDFGSTAFVLRNSKPSLRDDGLYRRLFRRHVDVRTPSEIERIFLKTEDGTYRTRQSDFEAIPGLPIAYWASDQQKKAFIERQKVGDWSGVKQGLATADNDRFIRLWHEVSTSKFGLGYSSTSATTTSNHKWYPYNKGGEYRRWYGNFEYVVNWENDGREIRNFADEKGKVRSRAQNTNFYFKEGVTWTFVSSGSFGVRYAPYGSVFDVAGSSAFPPNGYAKKLSGALASKVTSEFLSLINPTLNFQVGNIAALPFDQAVLSAIDGATQEQAIATTKSDWDAYETSWDFPTLPLLQSDHRAETLEATYTTLRTHWQGMTDEMQRLEEENNRIFIDAYGLPDELTPEVPLNEITLTCNPAYRYSRGSKTPAEQEVLLQADTMAEFIHYAVGCMFGRYSLDVPGLILANQGDGIEDYDARIAEPTFAPDDDNVIPILDGDWFADDITERFRDFLRVTFGDEHFVENLRFIEDSLGKDIRKYFLKDFYTDHVKRYKKRPIYWQFSSPKGYFNALIYMHRYRPDTVSVVLNGYLREFKAKLNNQMRSLAAITLDPAASDREKTKADKDIDGIKKALVDIEDYEAEILFPLAEQQIEIDLDDGVKQNYPKFGKALKKVVGLSAK